MASSATCPARSDSRESLQARPPVATGRRPSRAPLFTKRWTSEQSLGAAKADAELGYHGYGANNPRKYIKGPLRMGHHHPQRVMPPDTEYKKTCQILGAEPNSHITYLVKEGFEGDPAIVLGETWISLQKTYLGERGFLSILPLLDRNSHWTSLDASKNGLRNEAVLHLVDLLLRPPHRDRQMYLDLSGNPISETGGRALLALAQQHPHLGQLNLRHTKIPHRIVIMIRKTLEDQRDDDRVCKSCGAYMLADARFCKDCGAKREQTIAVVSEQGSDVFDCDKDQAALCSSERLGSVAEGQHFTVTVSDSAPFRADRASIVAAYDADSRAASAAAAAVAAGAGVGDADAEAAAGERLEAQAPGSKSADN